MQGEHLYLFGGEKLQRRHRIIKLSAFIYSEASDQVVFSITESKDLRFCGLQLSEVQQVLQMLKTRYHELNPQNTLKIYAVPKASLKEFAPEDDRKYNFESLPADQFRQRD